jgi:hypothetical protein
MAGRTLGVRKPIEIIWLAVWTSMIAALALFWGFKFNDTNIGNSITKKAMLFMKKPASNYNPVFGENDENI